MEEKPVFQGPISSREKEYIKRTYASLSIATLPTPKKQRITYKQQVMHVSEALIDEESVIFGPGKSANKELEAFVVGLYEPRENCIDMQRRENAAITLQSWWKMVLQSRNYVSEYCDVLLLQNWWRSVLLRLRKERIERDRAAMVIQSWWRINAKKMLMAEKERIAALLIQRVWRRSVAMKGLQRTKEATIRIENWWRGFQCVRNYKRIVSVAKLVESRRRFILDRRKIISIQKWWRECNKRRQRALEKAATKIQCCTKMFLARKKFLAQRKAFTEESNRVLLPDPIKPLDEKNSISTQNATFTVAQSVEKATTLSEMSLEEKKKVLMEIRAKKMQLQCQLQENVTVLSPKPARNPLLLQSMRSPMGSSLKVLSSPLAVPNSRIANSPLLANLPAAARHSFAAAVSNATNSKPRPEKQTAVSALSRGLDRSKKDRQNVELITQSNTLKNAGYRCNLQVEVEKREGKRPESPPGGYRNTMSLDDENFDENQEISMVKPNKIVWNSELTMVFDPSQKPGKVDLSQVPTKSCLKRKQKEYRGIFSPELRRVLVPVKRIEYEGDAKPSKASKKSKGRK